MSENIYERTYAEQIECGYKAVPILTKSPINSIYTTRLKYLTCDAVYRQDQFIKSIIDKNSKLPLESTLFKTDEIMDNHGNHGKLIVILENKGTYRVNFNELEDWLIIQVKKSDCINADCLFIKSFLVLIGDFQGTGLGHSIMGILKKIASDMKLNLEAVIYKTEKFSPEEFYFKEGFKYYPNKKTLYWNYKS